MLETYEQQTFIRLALNIINCEAFTHLEPKDRPVIFAVANGGRAGIRTGARYKAEGVLKGVPDICFTYPNGKHHGLFIEMKRPKGEGGGASPEQREVIANLQRYGYAVEVCRGWQEAEKVLREYISDGKKSLDAPEKVS